MLRRCVLVSVPVSVSVFVPASVSMSVSLYVLFVRGAAHRHWISVCPGCCTGVCWGSLCLCLCLSVFLFICLCLCRCLFMFGLCAVLLTDIGPLSAPDVAQVCVV